MQSIFAGSKSKSFLRASFEEAIKLYIANIEIWGCLFNQFRNPSLQEFQHEVKMNKVHKLAFTSLCGLLHIYSQLAQGRKIKETLEMMAYVSELSNDLTLQESARNYRKKFVTSILKFEEERVELEDIIVCGGEMILGQEAIRQMYQETAKDYIPDELPEMKRHMINRSLETLARTSKLLSAQFSKTMDELSANEVSTEERLIEAMEKEKQTRMDEEIKAIVDKEIAEFYKPKSLLDQEIQNELIEQVAKSLLSTLSPKAKRSATATMNTSVDQANSVDLVGTFSTGFPSHRVDSARDNDLKDLNLTERKAEVSAFFNGTKTSTRKESVATKVRRLAAFDNKWHTSLGNHASICKAVRDNAETPMHKKLGEIIIDSFKNPDETCRPVSE
jgi:hypothetical protein